MTVVRGLSWDHPRGHAPLLASAAAWAERRLGVRLEWTPRTLADFAAGGLAGAVGRFDLATVDHPLIGEAAEAGWLVPLEDVLPARTVDELTAGSVDGWSGSYRYAGRTWAAPLDAAALASAYRADLLDRHGLRLPGTVAELVQLARDSGRVAVPLSVFGAVALFCSLCTQLGEDPFPGPGRVAAGAGVRALELMADLAAAVPAYCLDEGAAPLLDRLSGGDDLAYVGYAYAYAPYARAGFAAHRLTFAAAPPVRAGASPRPTLGGVGLAVLGGAPQRAAAADFLAWVASESGQCGAYARGGGQPAARTAWRDRELDALHGGFYSALRPSLEQAYVRPNAAWFAVAQPAIGERIRAYLRHGRDPAAVLAGLTDVVRAAQRERA